MKAFPYDDEFVVEHEVFYIFLRIIFVLCAVSFNKLKDKYL